MGYITTAKEILGSLWVILIFIFRLKFIPLHNFTSIDWFYWLVFSFFLFYRIIAAFTCHDQGSSSLIYAPQHQLLISAGKKGDVCIFDVRQRQLRHRFQVTHSPITMPLFCKSFFQIFHSHLPIIVGTWKCN